jgi:hypothetical protein
MVLAVSSSRLPPPEPPPAPGVSSGSTLGAEFTVPVTETPLPPPPPAADLERGHDQEAVGAARHQQRPRRARPVQQVDALAAGGDGLDDEGGAVEALDPEHPAVVGRVGDQQAAHELAAAQLVQRPAGDLRDLRERDRAR